MAWTENPNLDTAAVTSPTTAAAGFHHTLDGYAPTPVRELADGTLVKDESGRLGLPAFKILGASWAVERALAGAPATTTLVAASAGNHGRAVAHEAARRGLECRVFLPARALEARREAIAGEGAAVEVVDGSYEECVALARAAGERGDTLEIADVGDSGPARDVIDGYATLFDEAAHQADFDVLVVPIGVGSLGAAAARFGARAGIPVVGAEPEAAACLTASLAAGEPTAVPTPGTTMAGLDCAEVSAAAWPDLRAGVSGTVTVSDHEAADAQRELEAAGMYIGESGAAPLAALRQGGLGPDGARVLLVATEGRTGAPHPG
ncbi:MAG TPA: pyridoxal-phosphate dependent enzyme [Thermoleophilaceae bacterium]|nr:pyridoxal-phosphate dependent enzyme [Thermoleophilaceae bacterium]